VEALNGQKLGRDRDEECKCCLSSDDEDITFEYRKGLKKWKLAWKDRNSCYVSTEAMQLLHLKDEMMSGVLEKVDEKSTKEVSDEEIGESECINRDTLLEKYNHR